MKTKDDVAYPITHVYFCIIFSSSDKCLIPNTKQLLNQANRLGLGSGKGKNLARVSNHDSFTFFCFFSGQRKKEQPHTFVYFDILKYCVATGSRFD